MAGEDYVLVSKGCTATVKGMWELLQTGRLVGGVEMEAVWRGLTAFDMYWDVTWCGERDDDGENGSVDGVNKGLSDMGACKRVEIKKQYHDISVMSFILQPFLHSTSTAA